LKTPHKSKNKRQKIEKRNLDEKKIESKKGGENLILKMALIFFLSSNFHPRFSFDARVRSEKRFFNIGSKGQR
jgi:hypothetical protein